VKKFYLQIYHHNIPSGDEDSWIDVSSLEIHPELAQWLAEFGIVEINNGYMRVSQAARLSKLQRLRSRLGVNIHGAAVILELLERIEALQEEIERLKRR